MDFVSPADYHFAPEGAAANARPDDGDVLIFGRLDHPDFRVDDLSQLAVVAPDGRRLPLHIDESSVFVEFDSIVSVEFFFLVEPAEAVPGGEPFKAVWGPGVRSENQKVPSIALDPATRDRVLQFVWRRDRDDAPAGTSVATIEVIADSTAEYYFLLYLLPMALIFILLTIRKIRARD